MVDLAIIIVGYNARAYLVDCLRSIFSLEPGFDLKVCVVDNGSDGSSEEVERNFPQVLLIRNPANPGFSASVNLALSRINGRYTLLLNPDSFVFGGALDGMVRFMDSHSDVGILGPKVYDDKGKSSVQLSCRSFPSWNSFLFHRYSLLSRLFPENPWSRTYLLSGWDHNSIRQVDWVSGCCMLIRKEVFDLAGLFDEGFFMFNEDVDFCFRARKTGWKILYFPEAEVAHYIGSSKGKVKPRLIIERHKSISRYVRKHCVKNPLLALIVDMAIFLRGGILLFFNALKQ